MKGSIITAFTSALIIISVFFVIMMLISSAKLRSDTFSTASLELGKMYVFNKVISSKNCLSTGETGVLDKSLLDIGHYTSDEFEMSGAEFVAGSIDDRIINNGEYFDLNVTVNVATNGTYWLGADLHKEAGWEWNFISFESTEQALTAGENNMTVLFNGQNIRNSGIDGPYHIKLELRDANTWTEQDYIERYFHKIFSAARDNRFCNYVSSY